VFTRLAHDLDAAYQRHLVHTGKEQAFWLLIAFLLTFIVVRLITHAIRAGRGPFHNLSIGGAHLHHLVPGIILILVTGYLASALDIRTARTINAIGFDRRRPDPGRVRAVAAPGRRLLDRAGAAVGRRRHHCGHSRRPGRARLGLLAGRRPGHRPPGLTCCRAGPGLPTQRARRGALPPGRPARRWPSAPPGRFAPRPVRRSRRERRGCRRRRARRQSSSRARPE